VASILALAQTHSLYRSRLTFTKIADHVETLFYHRL